MAIILKNSTTPGKKPTATDLVSGELALNSADGKVFMKKEDGTVIEPGGGGGSSRTATRFPAATAPIIRTRGGAPLHMALDAQFRDRHGFLSAGLLHDEA